MTEAINAQLLNFGNVMADLKTFYFILFYFWGVYLVNEF